MQKVKKTFMALNMPNFLLGILDVEFIIRQSQLIAARDISELGRQPIEPPAAETFFQNIVMLTQNRYRTEKTEKGFEFFIKNDQLSLGWIVLENNFYTFFFRSEKKLPNILVKSAKSKDWILC